MSVPLTSVMAGPAAMPARKCCAADGKEKIVRKEIVRKNIRLMRNFFCWGAISIYVNVQSSRRKFFILFFKLLCQKIFHLPQTQPLPARISLVYQSSMILFGFSFSSGGVFPNAADNSFIVPA